DIRYAVQELMDIAAVPKVALLGLRLGGLLAAGVAAKSLQISRLLLWDPVISGRDYVAEMTEEIELAQPNRSRAKFVSADGALHFNGFTMPSAFQAALQIMNLTQTDGLDAKGVAQIISHET